LILVTAFYSTTDQQDFEGGVKKSQSPQSITKRQVGSVFLGLFVFRVQQTQGVLVFFATMLSNGI
jgi:hypothetical protein